MRPLGWGLLCAAIACDWMWGMKRNGDGTDNGEWDTIAGVGVGVEVGNGEVSNWPSSL